VNTLKKIFHLFVIVIIILGFLQIVIPLNNIDTTASSPPPDDGVNGAYTQYIDGDWVVTGTESYSDEVIVLTGNLTIQAGGSLTLMNVTLAMNNTAANGTYYIYVNSGGSLSILDKDNDPTTTYDRSNITDSPFDSDNGNSTDFRTRIRVYSSGVLTIKNSIVRECGYSWNSYQHGLYIDAYNLVIENSTFENNFYGVYFHSGNDVSIRNNEFKNCYRGLSFYQYGSILNGVVQNNIAHNNEYGLEISGTNIEITNNTAHNNSKIGISLSRLYNSEFYNNTMLDNGGTSWTHNLYIGYSGYLQVYNNTIQRLKANSYHAVMITDVNNVDFYNNTVTYNDDQAVRCDLRTSSDTNVRFFNNNISNNQGTGLNVNGRYSTENYVEVINNVFYSNSVYGLSFDELLAYKITDNYVKGSSGGFIDATQNGDFSNNTFIVTGTDFYIRDTRAPNDDTFFKVVNCTFDPSSVWLTQGYATLIIVNYLHVKVTDNNGPAPNVIVNVSSTVNPSVSSFEGSTDENGFIRYIELINQTQKNTVSGTEYKYFDPHNITATSYGKTAYGVIEPVMDKSQTVNVNFNSDLPPERPNELSAVSRGEDVFLTWRPSFSPDLDHYLVYRNNSAGGWVLKYNSSFSIGEETWNNWTDVKGANNWATYSYKVIAVDSIFQQSSESNIARCGDWAIGDARVLMDLDIQLNGSLIILPTGDVTFKNVKLKINNTNLVEHGVNVQTGGKLAILDSDNNPLTTADRSEISALDTNYNYHFMVTSAEITIKNSKLTNCGSNDQLNFGGWNIGDGPLVITRGGPELRGIYIEKSVVTIESNEFSDNFVSILLNDVNTTTIKDNTFSDSIFGVYTFNSDNINITSNTFNNQDAFSTFLFDSGSNTVISNDFTTALVNEPEAAVGIYGSLSENNDVLSNDIYSGNNGIYLYLAGANNTVSNNNLFDQEEKGIYVQNSFSGLIMDNYCENITDTDYYIRSSNSFTITGGTSIDSYTGIWLESSTDIIVTDFVFENASNGAFIERFSSNVKVQNILTKSCLYGFAGLVGSDIELYNITVDNSTYGFYFIWNPVNVQVINSTVINSEEAVWIDTIDNIGFINCTFNATVLNFNLTSATVRLFNTTYNQTKVKLDSTSKIFLNWFFRLKVIDWFGSPSVNTNVQIRKALGTLVYNDFTDSSGYIKTILLERIQFSFTNETSTPYQISAYSGNHSGMTFLMLNRSTSLDLYLDNMQPTVSNIVIIPPNPDTIAKLTLEYQYSDAEFDLEDKTIIRWNVSGKYDPTFDNQTEILSKYTQKGQTWFCEVIPHDGAVYGPAMISMPVLIRNTPPLADNVRIDETNPTSADDLTVNYTYSDIDNDPETRSQHRWLVNDGTGWEYSGQDAMVLSSSYTKKGDSWKCEVTPGDGDDNGDPMESAAVQILNTPPEVSSVGFKKSSYMSNETLTVDYNFFDIDSDDDIGSTIQWFRDTEEQADFFGSLSIDAAITMKGEEWYYILTPRDGEDYGKAVESKHVLIGNTAPEVANIRVQPENPTTNDDLFVAYEFSDPDEDPEGKDTIIEWYRKRPGDIEFTRTGLKVKTLSSIYTNKNELWKCEVTPHDGVSYGKSMMSITEVTILNSRPVISDLQITPSIPTARDDLQAKYVYSDMDMDSEGNTQIIWYQDGNSIPELNNKLSVPKKHTAKGQVWQFGVRPHDGQDFGETVKSENITIQNSAPVAVNLTVTPESPLSDEDLKAAFTYYDIDGDSESTPEIKWYQNGLYRSKLDNTLIVESNFTEKGDIWYFTLRVSDGFDYSEIIISHYITIGNSMAVITGLSPNLGKIIINETDSEHFSIEAFDPDGDYLIFKWKLNDETVSSNDYFDFKTDYNPSGDYYSDGYYFLNLTIQDVGKKPTVLSFVWEITVLNVNRIPELTIIKPKTTNSKIKEDDFLEFEISESDPDLDDKLTITWYFDTDEIQSSGRTYTYVAKSVDVGDHTVRVVIADDKGGTTEHSWNVTVLKVKKTVEGFAGVEWDVWSIIIEAIVVIFTGIFAAIGIIKMRKKRSKLKEYMDKIENITSQEKPERQIELDLFDLKKEIKEEFSKGLITENHYIILERMVDDAIGDLRQSIVESRVSMPESLKEDVKEVLDDGMVTKDEYKELADKIRTTKELSEIERLKLNSLLSRWMQETKNIEPSEDPGKNTKSKNNSSKLKSK
jgi:parallel beta-helix repeat protein